MDFKNIITKNSILSINIIVLLSVIILISSFGMFQIKNISIASGQQSSAIIPSSSLSQQQQQKQNFIQNNKQQPSSSSSLSQNNQTTLSTIFKKAENSVVQITSTVSNPNTMIIINGNPVQSQSERLGSGFVFGNTYTAKVVGLDRDNDIAVLQITDDFSQENIIPLTIGNSSNLQVGQQISAVGNP